MAQPPSIRQIAQGSIENTMKMVSKFVQEVSDALSGQLTFGQNHAAQWVDLEFSDTVTTGQQRVDRLRGRQARGVTVQGFTVLTGTAPAVALAHQWTTSGDAVRISLITPLSAGTRLRVTFLVLPE